MAVHFEDDMTLRLSDDYVHPSSHNGNSYFMPSLNGNGGSLSSPTSEKDRIIRRRSSKACDNCRKAKCKCESGESRDTCRNCELLGLVCTFLGPSRKRGPPKGYIDAITIELHQLEALFGALVHTASYDSRVRSVLDDLRAADPPDKEGEGLAASVLSRIERGPFGFGAAVNPPGATGSGKPSRRHAPVGAKISITMPDDPFVIDPYEWQERLERAILRSPHAQPDSTAPSGSHISGNSAQPQILKRETSYPQLSSLANVNGSAASLHRPTLPIASSSTSPPSWANGSGEKGNTRRRLGSSGINGRQDSTSSAGMQYTPQQIGDYTSSGGASSSDEDDAEEEALVARGIGALSITDTRDVRYHGRSSGLHLLVAQKGDSRNSHSPTGINSSGADTGAQPLNALELNGTWHFPPPGVWPPIDRDASAIALPSLPRGAVSSPSSADASGRSNSLLSPPTNGNGSQERGTHHAERVTDERYAYDYCYSEEFPTRSMPLPNRAVQERLLRLYFAHVHPVLPIVNPDDVWRGWEAMIMEGSENEEHQLKGETSNYSQNNNPNKLSLALLYAIFAVAARYMDDDVGKVPHGTMWTAGLGYAKRTREICFTGKIPPRISTVQAFVLLSYLDAGLGAMAAAWQTSGLAMRTALDIGLNRPVDDWRTPEGSFFFSKQQAETCRRVWYCALIMENYIATFIGRAPSVHATDFDTPLPSDFTGDDIISYIPSIDPVPASGHPASDENRYVAGPSRIIETFRARAQLTQILGAITRQVYSVNPIGERRAMAVILEAKLDKWHLDLPESLQNRCPTSQACQAPHILMLHMDYWCSVLLLHRPFIRSKFSHRTLRKQESAASRESPSVQASKRAYGLCESAANRLMSLATTYTANFPMARCPAFITYYLFTGSIMQVILLNDNPEHPTARSNLDKSMSILAQMGPTWTSAGRAYDILDGVKRKIINSSSQRPSSHQSQRPTLQASLHHRSNSSGFKRQAEEESESLQYRSQLDYQRQANHETASNSSRQSFSSGASFHGASEIFENPPVNYGPPYNGAPPSLQRTMPPPLPPLDTRRFDSQFNVGANSRMSTPSMTPSSGWESTPISGTQPQPQYPPEGEYGGPRHAPPQANGPMSFPQQHLPSPFSQHQHSPQIPQQAPFPSEHQRSQHQAPQGFWNGFNAGPPDPFSNPSMLSTTLYTLPTLADRSQGHQQQHQHVNGNASTFSPYDRQSIPTASERYNYANMEQH